MQINSSRFGLLTIDEKDIVTFTDGIPGFENAHRFVFLPHNCPDGVNSPFKWMQSVEDGSLAFPVISPWQVCSDYAPTIPGGVLRDLQIVRVADQAKLWAIVTIPRDQPESATANLLAPVLINKESKTAKQVILIHERYAMRTPLRTVDATRNDDRLTQSLVGNISSGRVAAAA